ncbi:MAG: STAS domain-containing protein [Deltaproteobacteria bacterium]|nr:STAS domain-containing protein [Deltaproteobacteria bacterium]
MPRIETRTGVVVITPEGDINHSEMVRVKNVISESLRQGQTRFVLDLTEVDHINYMTLGVLVERAGRLHRSGGALFLAGLSGYLEKILRFTGVDELFQIFDTPELACVAHGAQRMQRSYDLVAGASGSWVPQMN